MDTEAQTAAPLDKRRREAHPEHLEIGGETFDRNDISAKNYSESERTHNRRDKEGAPYIFFGGVKYRPRKRLADFVLGSIRQDRPTRRGGR